MSLAIVYVCDTTALINYYDHFPVEFRRLKKRASDGVLKIPEGVFRELKRKTDKLFQFVEKMEKNSRVVVSMNSDPRLIPELARIERTYGEDIVLGEKRYPGFWKSPAGIKAADGQVVSVGKVLGCVVVSDDRAVRLACSLENIECVGWAEFARRMRGGGSSSQIEMDFSSK